MTHEEFRELWFDDALDLVSPGAYDSWRNGCYCNEVFKDLATGKFWNVQYTKSDDGEEHGLREGDFELHEVEPYEETITVTYFRLVY